jgi:hypothetical protein
LKTADTAHNEGSSAFAKAGERESGAAQGQSRAAELELSGVSKRYAAQLEPAIVERLNSPRASRA